MDWHSVLDAVVSKRGGFSRQSRGYSSRPAVHLDTCEYFAGESELALLRLVGRLDAVQPDQIALLGTKGERYDPLPDGRPPEERNVGAWSAGFSVPIKSVEQRQLMVSLGESVIVPLPPAADRSVTPADANSVNERIDDALRETRTALEERTMHVQALRDERLDDALREMRAVLEERAEQVQALRDALNDRDQQIQALRDSGVEQVQSLREALDGRTEVEGYLRAMLASAEHERDEARHQVTALRNRLAKAARAADQPDAPDEEDWPALQRDLIERLGKAKGLTGSG